MPAGGAPVKAAPAKEEEKAVEKKRPKISLGRKPAKAKKVAAGKK
jgi:hypothetical protein